LLGKYTSPELDPDPEMAVKILDLDPRYRYSKRSGSDRIPDLEPQCWFILLSLHI
jgi:hypothetical protein